MCSSTEQFLLRENREDYVVESKNDKTPEKGSVSIVGGSFQWNSAISSEGADMDSKIDVSTGPKTVKKLSKKIAKKGDTKLVGLIESDDEELSSSTLSNITLKVFSNFTILGHPTFFFV